MTRTTAVPRPALHVVVTCANRKRQAVPSQQRLGGLREHRPGLRFAAWTRRVANGVTTIPAIDLYGGEHWQIARDLPATAGQPAELWVCSAGYGLIPAAAPIRPYAATFAAGEKDSVGSSVAELRDWWKRLSQWPGPAADQPRSFADLARRDPDATIVCVLSEAYQRACSADLRDAAAHLADDEQLSVIGPAGRCAHIDDLIVPVTARLRPVVGGSLQALNVRAAAYVLATAAAEAIDLRRSQLRTLVARAVAQAPEDTSRRPAGRRLTDDDVRAYIRAQLADGPATATRLLRLLRDSGLSCEQARFKQLFTEEAGARR